MHGNLIIVSAPSGAGKTTLVGRLLERIDGIRPSISYTARAPRPGEIDGVHYHFVSPAQFERMRDGGEFLEWAVVHENYYGTSLQAVEDIRRTGLDVVLTIDVQGATNARRIYPAAVSIFILPPSREVLESRLNVRGANPSPDLRVRLNNARYELEHYRAFDYLVVNDDLESATEEMTAIIRAERCRRERRSGFAEKVLENFFAVNGGNDDE
ncbi:MAG: guanylate kinase [Acidobacteria bacterium]|nr:guanylate kinase [Acidobacteriota bacterium]MCW5969320.1 guanylate kinase [Blastocatellales bacterium]